MTLLVTFSQTQKCLISTLVSNFVPIIIGVRLLFPFPQSRQRYQFFKKDLHSSTSFHFKIWVQPWAKKWRSNQKLLRNPADKWVTPKNPSKESEASLSWLNFVIEFPNKTQNIYYKWKRVSSGSCWFGWARGRQGAGSSRQPDWEEPAV